MNCFFLMVCCIWVGSPPTSAPTASDPAVGNVEAKLVKMIKDFKSFSANVTQKIDNPGAGSWFRAEGTGSIEYLIREGKILFRADLITDNITTIGADEVTTHDVHSMYCDGQFAYDIGESNGEKMAVKLKIDPMQSAIPTKDFFDALRQNYTLKLLPDEKVDGKDAWVLEIRPIDLSKSPASRMVSRIRKDIPLIVKTVSYDKYDRPFQWLTLSDIKINPKLDPERFVAKKPEGVEWLGSTQAPIAVGTTQPSP